MKASQKAEVDLRIIDGNPDASSVEEADSIMKQFNDLMQSFYGKYRIGIVTALPKELAAVLMVFDPEPQDIFSVMSNNRYFAAKVRSADGRFNHVVICICSNMGNNASAIAAMAMLNDFRFVESIIMTGIAGGAPNLADAQKDVWLGDVVVSDGPGLIQYDMVKAEDNSVSIRSAPPKPDCILAKTAKFIECERIMKHKKDEHWIEYISLSSRIEHGASPPRKKDKNCGKRLYSIEGNARRRMDHPVVHFGVIGSANTLLKKQELRDRLRDEYNVRAIEMEGSGVAEAAWFSGKGYSIVRGICDYCDMDKSNIWQGYASAVAAAYTRALIEGLPAL